MFDKRNYKIYYEWIEGKEYNQLAEEFGLAKSTIKEICISHLPTKVRGQVWRGQNSYKRFRQWYKAIRQKEKPDHTGKI